MTPARHRLYRSILFCPGSRPERFAKGLASGADAVCLDLEDGVGPDAKDVARDAVASFLVEWNEGSAGAPDIVVRVNDPRTPLGARDVEVLAGSRLPHAVMVPKVDGPDSLDALARVLSVGALDGESVPRLLPLIETVRGLDRAGEIASAGLPLGALVFGGMDLSAELGARFEWEPLLYARSRVVHAAALAGVGAIDVPWAPLDDPEGLENETRRAARLGFTGKLAIHPAQVSVIHRGLAPDPEELAAARRIVEATARASEGVVVVDGRMVDRPVVLGAERILARAGEAHPR
jgi:citrate lyase beta subunit